VLVVRPLDDDVVVVDKPRLFIRGLELVAVDVLPVDDVDVANRRASFLFWTWCRLDDA
jgi:hypothetical protein